jgi:diguanylate cyclase (GGDEF)-like protein
MTRVIRKNLREDDIVSRLGGDEFTIILLNISNEIIEKKIIEIEKDFQKSLSKMKIDVKAGIDIGFAYYRKKETYESLMDRADERMYKIKESRK